MTSARIALYTTLDRSDLAVEAALEYLRRVGIEWSAHPTDDEVRREYDRIWQQLGPRAIEELVDLPPMTDPEHRATMDVLALAQSPALFTDEKLHSLVICRMVNLSLEHGNSDGSCIGYVWLGTILGRGSATTRRASGSARSGSIWWSSAGSCAGRRASTSTSAS